jgi:hypothetical protein
MVLDAGKSKIGSCIQSPSDEGFVLHQLMVEKWTGEAGMCRRNMCMGQGQQVG